MFTYHKTEIHLNAVGDFVTVSRCTLLNKIFLRGKFIEEVFCLKGKEIDRAVSNVKKGAIKDWLEVKGNFGPAGGAAA